MGKVIMWTDEEIKFLMENWSEMSASEIGERIGRPASGVRQKGQKLGLKTDTARFEKITGLKVWTKEEDEYLVKSWGKIKKASIADKLGRKPKNVEKRAHHLGLRMTDEELEAVTNMKRWTPDDEKYIVEHYGKISTEEIAKNLGRRPETVKKRASILGVTKTYTKWTEDKEEYLQDYWGGRSVVATAEYFGTSVDSIKYKASQMGLGKQMEATGNWYTARNIHELLGVGLRTVYGWKKDGLIKFNKIRTSKDVQRFRVSINNLKSFLEEHPEKYDTRECDLREVKALFTNSKINNSDNLIVSDIPLWLQRKINSDKTKPRKMAPREWTLKELKQLSEYEKNGYSHSQMAELLKRSEGSIKLKLYTMKKAA